MMMNGQGPKMDVIYDSAEDDVQMKMFALALQKRQREREYKKIEKNACLKK